VTDRPLGRCALAWSGGKDSTLALHRARMQGYAVTNLITVCDGATERVPYHGLRAEVLRAQASCLGVEPLIASTLPERDFEATFELVLDELGQIGVEAVVFGNIHLEDVRAWYEERVSARGFEHVEPLWGAEPARLLREFVQLGYRARIVSVQEDSGADPAWLGRDFDADLLESIFSRSSVDPCGERGEFHSFCYDGPLFQEPVSVEVGEPVTIEGHRVLDLTLPGRA